MTFPAKVGEFNDDLTDEQRRKLEAATSTRRAGVDPTVSVPVWTPDGGKTWLPQTEPDPKTGKRLLLD